MYGVVLWSDTRENKAVIWCEDHGDLAYYRKTGVGDRVMLDAGDWVQFDVTRERQMRYAHNPRLVAEGVCAGLADSLKRQGEGRARWSRAKGEVISFAPALRRRSDALGLA